MKAVRYLRATSRIGEDYVYLPFLVLYSRMVSPIGILICPRVSLRIRVTASPIPLSFLNELNANLGTQVARRSPKPHLAWLLLLSVFNRSLLEYLL